MSVNLRPSLLEWYCYLLLTHLSANELTLPLPAVSMNPPCLARPVRHGPLSPAVTMPTCLSAGPQADNAASSLWDPLDQAGHSAHVRSLSGPPTHNPSQSALQKLNKPVVSSSSDGIKRLSSEPGES